MLWAGTSAASRSRGGPDITPRLEVSPQRPEVPWWARSRGPGRETHGRAPSGDTCWASRPQRAGGWPPADVSRLAVAGPTTGASAVSRGEVAPAAGEAGRRPEWSAGRRRGAAPARLRLNGMFPQASCGLSPSQAARPALWAPRAYRDVDGWRPGRAGAVGWEGGGGQGCGRGARSVRQEAGGARKGLLLQLLPATKDQDLLGRSRVPRLEALHPEP